MHHSDFILAETSCEAFNHLPRQGDLRHQHYGSHSLSETSFDYLHVHLGLAAGSDTMEKKYLLFIIIVSAVAEVYSFSYLIHRRLLLCCESFR